MLKFLKHLYRLYWFYSSPEKLVMRRAIKAFVTERGKYKRVLEIGGGNGMMKPIITKAADVDEFISSDIAASDSTDVVCDAQDMPFENAAFDLVMALEVMEHVPDTKAFLSEIQRVLKPDGEVIISVPFVFGEHDFQDFYRWTP